MIYICAEKRYRTHVGNKVKNTLLLCYGYRLATKKLNHNNGQLLLFYSI